jgi:hypothetical protein
MIGDHHTIPHNAELGASKAITLMKKALMIDIGID